MVQGVVFAFSYKKKLKKGVGGNNNNNENEKKMKKKTKHCIVAFCMDYSGAAQLRQKMRSSNSLTGWIMKSAANQLSRIEPITSAMDELGQRWASCSVGPVQGAKPIVAGRKQKQTRSSRRVSLSSARSRETGR